MNFMFLDKSPHLAAVYQCNSHVQKLICESAQMLSTTHHYNYIATGEYSYIPPCKACYQNHPCNLWLRKQLGNYLWACHHMIYLCEEHMRRGGSRHAYYDAAFEFLNNPPSAIDKTESVSFPALAMPDIYKTDDPVLSYRLYYYYVKRHLPKFYYKNADIPEWFNEIPIKYPLESL